MTIPVDSIPRTYIELAWALERHVPGYIDTYYGPPEWRCRRHTAELRPVSELLQEITDLTNAVASKRDSQRQDFLARQIQAMQASLRILQGERLALSDEVEALYDIKAAWTNEAIFEEARRTLDELLPPGDSLAARLSHRKKALRVPVEKIESLLHRIIAELRRRTQARFPLPSDESVELRFVNGQPWKAYSWYLGNYHSRIDINTDAPLHITDLVGMLAHEGYPGHHTELSLKESQLVRGQGYIEHSIVLVNSPFCVVAEGIASHALSMLFSDSELAAWQSDEVFRPSGFGYLDAHREQAIDNAGRGLKAATGNAAFLLHDQSANEDAVAAYLQHYGLQHAEESRRSIAFLKAPLFRSYVFAHCGGAAMLDLLFAVQDHRDRWFARLLTEPVTPSQIRTWAASLNTQ